MLARFWFASGTNLILARYWFASETNLILAGFWVASDTDLILAGFWVALCLRGEMKSEVFVSPLVIKGQLHAYDWAYTLRTARDSGGEQK